MIEAVLGAANSWFYESAEKDDQKMALFATIHAAEMIGVHFIPLGFGCKKHQPSYD